MYKVTYVKTVSSLQFQPLGGGGRRIRSGLWMQLLPVSKTQTTAGPIVAKVVVQDIWEAETAGSSIQASLGNLVRLCFKIKSIRRASGCMDI